MFFCLLIFTCVICPEGFSENLDLKQFSCKARKTLPFLKFQDVPYGDLPMQKLDIHTKNDLIATAESGKILPLVIFIHGGGWHSGDKADVKTGMLNILADQGITVISINYRLAGPDPDELGYYPASLLDAQQAVRFVRTFAKNFCLNPNKLGLVGSSAGGWFVQMLGFIETLPQENPKYSTVSSRGDCIVDFYGPAVMLDQYVFASESAPLGKDSVKNYLQCKPEENPGLYEESSPITKIGTDGKLLPPICIIHGTDDSTVSVEQSRKLFQSLKDIGADVGCTEIASAGHGWLARSRYEEQSTPVMIEFLKKHIFP